MIKRIKDALKAWKRGDKKVVKGAARGRIYEKKEDLGPPGRARVNGKLAIKMKITRSDGSIEYKEVK